MLRYLVVKNELLTKSIAYVDAKIDQLNDYRHFGDLRYLTDVESGKFDKVQLLRNPNGFDVLQWFWRHIFVSLGMPVKSHSLAIYRKKLSTIALQRMQQKPRSKAFGYFS